MKFCSTDNGSNNYAHKEFVQEYMFNGNAMPYDAAERPVTARDPVNSLPIG